MRKQIKIKTELIASVGVFSAFVISLLGVNATTHATGVTDEINVTIPASCSLTSVVGSAHTSTIETGVYQDDIGETTFKVFCNDSEGFAAYAVGYTNDTFGNNTLKPTNLASSYAIVTGTATSGDTSNWAMKLTAVTGDYAPTIHSTEENSNAYSFTSYHTIPSEYTKVASYSSNTDATTGSSFKSTYAVYASPTQPADSYTGKVKYTVMHPASEAVPVEISQLTYMQDFRNLTPGQRATVLNSMEYNTIYNLIDNRDNKTYQVAKLKDDNIWMAENLDLGRTALTTDLTSQNTNLDTNAANVAASDFNSWIKSSGTESYTAAELIPVTGTDATSNTPYGTLYNYCAASAGTICLTGGTNNDDATSDLCPAGWRLPTGGSTGEFGALYSLTDYNTDAKMKTPIVDGGAAFALAGYFGNSSPVYQGSSGGYWSSSRYDNWSMRYLYLTTSNVSLTSGYYRNYGSAVRCIAKKPSRTLTIIYGTGVSSIEVNGVMVPDGGIVNMEEGFPYSITMTPSAGYLFSSWSGATGTIDSTGNQTTIYTAGNNDTTLTANASYITTEIQNLSSSNCTTTASHVRDNRDDHVYIIQRLTDGNCWMMENLDLGRTELTTDLTSSNTNLINTITASTFNGWKKTSGSGTYAAGEFIPVEGIGSTSKTPYGTLYNFYVASAGTILGSSNRYNAVYDICPSGWRLPTGNTTGEFQALYNLTDYNTYEKMQAPISRGGAAFALAGYFSNSIPVNQESYSYYWSSTRYSDSSMYVLYLNKTRVSPSDILSRNDGFAMRCILNS